MSEQLFNIPEEIKATIGNYKDMVDPIATLQSDPTIKVVAEIIDSNNRLIYVMRCGDVLYMDYAELHQVTPKEITPSVKEIKKVVRNNLVL